MQVKSKSGREFDIPPNEEATKIHERASVDKDAFTLDEFTKMRPVGRPKAAVTKERVTIRLSPDVTAFFRATGKGWQTRMDEALREYVETHR
ncbi:MAG: BrnA antitoxin family protein [Sedimenticola sp.]